MRPRACVHDSETMSPTMVVAPDVASVNSSASISPRNRRRDEWTTARGVDRLAHAPVVQ